MRIEFADAPGVRDHALLIARMGAFAKKCARSLRAIVRDYKGRVGGGLTVAA